MKAVEVLERQIHIKGFILFRIAFFILICGIILRVLSPSAVWSGGGFPTLRRDILSPSSGSSAFCLLFPYSLTLMMEAGSSFEASICFYQTVQCRIWGMMIVTDVRTSDPLWTLLCLLGILLYSSKDWARVPFRG
jgi:hypothetical protein